MTADRAKDPEPKGLPNARNKPSVSSSGEGHSQPPLQPHGTYIVYGPPSHVHPGPHTGVKKDSEVSLSAPPMEYPAPAGAGGVTTQSHATSTQTKSSAQHGPPNMPPSSSSRLQTETEGKKSKESAPSSKQPQPQPPQWPPPPGTAIVYFPGVGEYPPMAAYHPHAHWGPMAYGAMPPPPPPPQAGGPHRGPPETMGPPPQPYWVRDSRLAPPPQPNPPPQARGQPQASGRRAKTVANPGTGVPEGTVREGATSPTQIELSHRDEVQHMGCTCKKTRCLKLYCQCFGVKLFCGGNCRCVECFNTRRHEKQRKEAMRSILLRNPGAFDTKFRKTAQNAPGTGDTAPSAVTTTAVAPTEGPGGQPLAHKVGCKCRKSACMKKYCECFAGSVKCSASCRCMGCQNMGSMFGATAEGGYGSLAYLQPRPGPILPRPAGVSLGPVHPSPVNGNNGSGEPWLAAQNLTFLKRGSPASAEKKRKSEQQEITSMPSLASSSEGSPQGTGDRTSGNQDEDDAEGGVSSLLMAAYAMTEFAGDGTAATSPAAKKTKAAPVSTPSSGTKSSFSTPPHKRCTPGGTPSIKLFTPEK